MGDQNFALEGSAFLIVVLLCFLGFCLEFLHFGVVVLGWWVLLLGLLLVLLLLGRGKHVGALKLRWVLILHLWLLVDLLHLWLWCLVSSIHKLNY